MKFIKLLTIAGNQNAHTRRDRRRKCYNCFARDWFFENAVKKTEIIGWRRLWSYGHSWVVCDMEIPPDRNINGLVLKPSYFYREK